MIKGMKIPVCAVCGWAWLPSNPEYREHPERIPRCSSCKSRRWNDDDPQVLAAKSRTKEITPSQRAKQLNHVAAARHRSMLAGREGREIAREHDAMSATSEAAAQVQRKAPVLRLCKHKLILAKCPICSKVM